MRASPAPRVLYEGLRGQRTTVRASRIRVKAQPEFEVTIERAASDEELHEVRQAFAEARLNASVRAVLEFKSAESDAISALLIVGPLMAFLAAFAKAAGDDAYRNLKEFVKRAGGRRNRPGTGVWLQDNSEKGIDIGFGPELSDEAYRELFELDLSEAPEHCIVRYEEDAGDWMFVFERRPVPRKRRDVAR